MNQIETATAHKERIAKNEKRINELNRIFNALYEDKALGALSAERFAEMTATYEQEITTTKAQNAELQTELDKINSEKDKTEKFLKLIRKYTRFEELTTPMLNELVDKVIVHEGEWSEGYNKENGRPMGIRSQRVDVYLKYIGKFDIPDMRTAEEIEKERRAAEKLERKRKYNREYMRQKNAEKRAAKNAEKEKTQLEKEQPKKRKTA